MNVKYLYYHQEDSLTTDFKYLKTQGTFDIYENPAKGMSIGYLMNDSIKDWYYDSAYPFRVQNDLGEQAFDVFELFHDIEIDDPATNGLLPKLLLRNICCIDNHITNKIS